MRLYAKQLGWLHTKTSAKAKQTRGQQQGTDAKLPSVTGAEYVLDIALDIGISGTTWRDVQAWCDVKRTQLTPWESNAVMEISRTYEAAMNEYRDKTAAAPYAPVKIDRDKVAADVRQALRRRR